MTERRERDPKRIAQLLASEVTGRSAGPLGRVTVVDAEPEATPSADGALAYRLALEAADDGERPSDSGERAARERSDEGAVATDASVEDGRSDPGEGSAGARGGGASRVIGAIHLHQSAPLLTLPAPGPESSSDLDDRVLSAGERAIPADREDVAADRASGSIALEIRTGAAVKPAVDVLAAIADRAGDGSVRDDAPGADT